MSRILIVYSTTDGHTREICARLRKLVEAQRHQVELVSVDDADAADLAAFDKIVIGASIRYGKHHKKVYDFVERNRDVLDSRPNAFFSVNVVARKPQKNRPETNPYLQKFLRQISWRPRMLAVFAGKIDYQKYGWLDRNMIRLIMWMTKGPTDSKANIEFTDWAQVEAFAQTICDM